MRNGHRNESARHRIRSVLEGLTRSMESVAYNPQVRLNDDGSSFSGDERDHLFLNRAGAHFYDVSAVAGVDSRADGRSSVIWDYDRDGWPDLAVANANSPQLLLYRNDIGRLPGHGGPGAEMIAVRFVGGNRTTRASPWGPRDGYGAKALVDVGGTRIERELRAGEGLAGQNSGTVVIGIGPRPFVDRLTVRWPSGRVGTRDRIRAGTLVTAFEDASESADGSGFRLEPYVRSPGLVRTRDTSGATGWRLLPLPPDEPRAALRLFTTLATWCEACRREVPLLARLREAFREDELALYGVPVDLEDTAAKLEAWMAELSPPYRLLTGLSGEQVSLVQRVVLAELGLDAVPATIVTDAAGRVLLAQWGPPQVSQIRGLLAERTARAARR